MAVWQSSMESMAIKKILITGSEGYIGMVLIDKLLHKGYKVIGLDTNYYSSVTLGSRRRPYRLLHQDIRNITKINFSGIDAIIHLAALSNDPTGEINPRLTNAINYNATVSLAKAAKREGVRRFLFSSSCSIYGIAKTDVVTEKSPVNPLTAYARSKIACEKALTQLADDTFTVALLRNSTVYGFSPRFRNDLVVNNLVTSALATGEIRIMSDGTPWRPLIDVRDLSEIFIKILKTPSKKINGMVVNVGFSENNFRVHDIVDLIKRELPDCHVVYTSEHGQDARSYKVNFSKFHHLFPTIKQHWPLKRSIKDLIVQLRKNHFSSNQFVKGYFTRLETLKKLTSSGRLNPNLYWITNDQL